MEPAQYPQIDIVAKNDERRSGIAGVSDQTMLLAVTRTGTAGDEVPIRCFGPADLLAAWPRES